MSAESSFDIDKKVIDYIVETLNVAEDQITPDAHLTNDLGAESIDILDVLFRLEGEIRDRVQQRCRVPLWRFIADLEDANPSLAKNLPDDLLYYNGSGPIEGIDAQGTLPETVGRLQAIAREYLRRSMERSTK